MVKELRINNMIKPIDIDILLASINKPNNNQLYHISKYNLDGVVIKPRVPKNFLVKNGYEDSETHRVSFSTTIENCLIGLARPCYKQYFYVHIPDNYTGEIYYPTIDEVPDVEHNKEVWLLNDVKLKVIGKIYVNGFDDKTLSYKYGNNTADLYRWYYDIVEEY